MVGESLLSQWFVQSIIAQQNNKENDLSLSNDNLCYDCGKPPGKRDAYAGFSRGDLSGRVPAHEFTKAARELSITQPAVSHHIRYLEQAYGAALFRHNGKRLQLTEAGEILRRTLLTMKHDEQHLQKRMQQAATGTRDYSFGATLSVAEFMLNEALGRFCTCTRTAASGCRWRIQRCC